MPAQFFHFDDAAAAIIDCDNMRSFSGGQLRICTDLAQGSFNFAIPKLIDIRFQLDQQPIQSRIANLSESHMNENTLCLSAAQNKKFANVV